ncbi:TolC family protein [Puniceicoccaceae bacterium K14]|nr:TolC family protein [Puniceicoccaceae bacterium K14]
MFSLSQKLLCVSAISLLVGCGTTDMGDEVNEAVGEIRGSETSAVPDSWTMSESVVTTEVDWVGSFNDAVLQKLIEEAQANNKDLRAALANVEYAQALARQAGAGLKPSVGITGSGSRSEGVSSGSSESTSLSLGAQVSWEVDLWGRVRSGALAAVASQEAAEADYRYTQHSIAAATAKAYFTNIEAEIQLEIARENLKIAEETLRIATVKYDNGMASAQDLALSKSDFATAKESLVSLEGSQRDAARSLELLLGRYPSAELTVRDSLPEVPAPPAAGVPSGLLERRPDLIAAERRVAAAFNATNQAKAARLPSISLTGTVGGASNELSNLLNPSNVAWSLASSLLAPLFDGGLGQAQVDAASADQKAAIAAYGQAALIAFQEVETNLDQGVVLTRRIDELKIAEEEISDAYRLAELLYKEGEVELLDLLSYQGRMISIRSSLASVKRLLLEQRVDLHLALGGDWRG